jgi:branched-subunit amino acid transport protein
MALFIRHPSTNFIFDEQEALLANPYVRAASDHTLKIGWLQAFRRDFWGLTPERTIGSYRPLPDIIWRALWKIGAREQTAFFHAYLNVLIHGLNGALLVLLVARWTRDRLTAWLAGAIFVSAAVLTEAVSGVVGLADVLGGTGVLLALLSLTLPLSTMPLALAASTLLGLYSKESALCIVPLAPLAALLTSNIFHRERGRAWVRTLVATLSVVAAFVFYVQTRRHLFPVVTPVELSAQANAGKPLAARAFAALLRWYAQPTLPRDPLNNPLVDATAPYRVAGAFRVYAHGLAQVLVPWTLSGDYSSPQEPIPDRLVFPASVVGGAAMIVPLLACPVLSAVAWRQCWRLGDAWRSRMVVGTPIAVGSPERTLCVAFAMAWVVISYFPVSNIPIVLPTVRAERFWYFPVIGTSMLLGIGFAALLRKVRGTRLRGAVVLFISVFFVIQCGRARGHAFDYKNDLVFWNATRKAAPNSAKAHLNYSVMLGARGDLNGRLESNVVALRLAPKWPMASVYMGDTLCRMHRPQDALAHYLRGFSLGPNDSNLIALGLQCLWDEHELGDDSSARQSLEDEADQYPGSWFKYLVDDTLSNGQEYKGVNPKYRPRGYNEGPKKDD